MRKPAFCICENKDADQLRGTREADQRLCFRYTDSSISLLHKSRISSLLPSSVAVQPGLCRTWSETPKTGFLTTRLKYDSIVHRRVNVTICITMHSFLDNNDYADANRIRNTQNTTIFKNEKNTRNTLSSITAISLNE